MDTVRTRVAPSPTGLPHVGTAYQALFDFVWARKHGGQFILRIEDTDIKREVEGAEEAIFDALDWLGLRPDEGPHVGGEYGPYRQSERLGVYKKYAEELADKGFAYYCFCTESRLESVRKDQKVRQLPPRYDRCCRDGSKEAALKRISSGEKACIRMKIPDNEKIVVRDLIRGDIAFDSNTLDDQVILKSDGYPTYHLAVVVDDYLMKISHAIRGEEWLPSAPKHVLLYRYMEWETPIFVHLPVLRNPDHSKMSKREGHASVFWYRDEGFLPEALLNFLAAIVWHHPEGKEIFGVADLIKYFDFKDMSYAAPVFDLTKLEWMNGEYIRALSVDEFLSRLNDYQKTTGKKDLEEAVGEEKLRKLSPLIQERIKKLSEVEALVDYFFVPPTKEPVTYEFSQKPILMQGAKNMFEMALDGFGKLEGWTISDIHRVIDDVILATSWKKGDFCMALRIAVTGKSVSLPLFESMEVLGKEECLRRIEFTESNL